jgi:hypothetical protein
VPARNPIPRKQIPILLFFENGIQIAELDPPLSYLLAVLLFEHVRLGPEQTSSFDDCLFKWEMFESMQGIVMYEHADRPLGGKHMGGVLNHVNKAITAADRRV